MYATLVYVFAMKNLGTFRCKTEVITFSSFYVLVATCPVGHGTVPVIPVEPDVSSDYDSASSLSSSSYIEQNQTVPDQQKIFGVTFDQLKRAMKIKRNFLPAKLCYFLFYSSRSLFATYYILFLTSTGLDPKQAGSIHGIRMVFITLGALFWGFLADKSKKDVVILTIKFITFALLVFSKPWIAYWVGSNNETRDEHRKHIKNAVENTLSELNSTLELNDVMEHSNEVINSMFGLSWEVTHYKSAEIPLYVSMLGLGIASAFSGGAIHVLIDSKIQQMAKECSRSSSAYGRQRLWGSVAYSITPVLAGVILETTPVNNVSKYMPVFYMHLLFMTFGLLSCIVLYKQKPKQKPRLVPTVATGAIDGSETTATRPEPRSIAVPAEYESIGSLIRRMAKNVNMICFFVHVLLVGMANGLQWSFQFLHMEEMGMSKTMMGFCNLTQCMTESMLFPVASKVINKLGGNDMARSFGLFGYVILFGAFAWFKNPDFLMIPTCAVGFCFTLYYTASMDELYYIGNPRCMTSLYALYNSVLIGLGSGVAGTVGGVIYKSHGGKTLYFGASILYLLFAVLSVLYTILHKRGIVKGQDKRQIYTQFQNKASYVVQCISSGDSSKEQSKSDEAIFLTMEAETIV